MISERHYLKMLYQARREVIIANAYFFPAIVSLRLCVKRHSGVWIKSIIQGELDMLIVRVGTFAA